MDAAACSFAAGHIMSGVLLSLSLSLEAIGLGRGRTTMHPTTKFEAIWATMCLCLIEPSTPVPALTFSSCSGINQQTNRGCSAVQPQISQNSYQKAQRAACPTPGTACSPSQVHHPPHIQQEAPHMRCVGRGREAGGRDNQASAVLDCNPQRRACRPQL